MVDSHANNLPQVHEVNRLLDRIAELEAELTDEIATRKRIEQERKADIHFLESIERLNRIMLQESDLEVMLEKVLQSVLTTFACDRAWLLFPCDPNTETWSVPMECTRPEYPGALAANRSIPATSEVAVVFREVLDSPDPVVYDPRTCKAVPEAAKAFGVQSQIQMAVRPFVGAPWLFGLHQCSHERIWSDEDRRLFQEIGFRIAEGLSSMLLLRTLRESEERFRTLVEHAPEAIVLIDMDTGRFVDVNENATRLFRMDRRALSKVGPFQMSPPLQPDGRSSSVVVQELMERSLTGEELVYEWLHRDAQGNDFPCEVRLVLMPSVDHKIVRASIIDISERKESEERLDRQEAMLAHATRLSTVGELLAEIAHEINQPLYSVLNFAKASRNMLTSGKPPDWEMLHGWNERITDSVNRAAQIITGLKGFVARSEQQRKHADVRQIIRESVDLVAFDARRLGARVDVQLDAGPLPVLVDRVQMQQVLVNLLKNAYEAMAEAECDERCVSIRGAVVGEAIEIVVADSGPGLPRLQDDASIFDAFVTTKPQGMGLGLAISRTIVEAHGGQLRAEPGMVQGAAFHLSLPIAQGDAADTA